MAVVLFRIPTVWQFDTVSLWLVGPARWEKKPGSKGILMNIALALCLSITALYALHRIALWAEYRGWIFYRHRKPDSTSVGNAMLQLQQLVEPSKRNVIEMKQTKRRAQDVAGEPPSPPTD
jgi:hypothetical protein